VSELRGWLGEQAKRPALQGQNQRLSSKRGRIGHVDDLVAGPVAGDGEVGRVKCRDRGTTQQAESSLEVIA
jgi:hypothetical protein